MLNWEPLIDCKLDALGIGTLFRCPAKHPYEPKVDFMLVNYPSVPSQHALIVTSGYKAGHILLALPTEAKSEKDLGISTKWLIQNWQKWVYEIEPIGVYLTKGYIIDKNWTPN